ncbi:DUF943 family protein [Erwinia mallotivora]|uniref:Membrane protein n=1 Tax=Erwinia mallotivora TaxID=69222 RepID=A0A014N343_9GAMM|nr:DUF943 family protein [Erwinia mallotivora]EXU73793.1 membrane protein [Erwinia mallotivora]
MMIKYRASLFFLFILGGVILFFSLWMAFRPVKIVAVHVDHHCSDILVRNFPFIDQGKIKWWLENKSILKEKYNIPRPDSNGTFMVVFWLFGDGYIESDGYDSLCFNDMNVPKNCIEKRRVFSVETGRNGNILFTSGDAVYRMDKKRNIVKRKN